MYLQNLHQFRVKNVQFDMSHEDEKSLTFDHPTKKKARNARYV